MNTKLLRMARRDSNGVRRWSVPGYSNQIILTPSNLSGRGWGTALHWPGRDAKGEYRRGVDLDRHHKLAKAEIRTLLDSVPVEQVSDVSIYRGPYRRPTMIQIVTWPGHLTPKEAALIGRAEGVRVRHIQHRTNFPDQDSTMFGKQYQLDARGAVR